MPRGDEKSEELQFIDIDAGDLRVGFAGASYDDEEEDDGYGLPADDSDSLWDSADDDECDDEFLHDRSPGEGRFHPSAKASHSWPTSCASIRTTTCGWSTRGPE